MGGVPIKISTTNNHSISGGFMGRFVVKLSSGK